MQGIVGWQFLVCQHSLVVLLFSMTKNDLAANSSASLPSDFSLCLFTSKLLLLAKYLIYQHWLVVFYFTIHCGLVWINWSVVAFHHSRRAAHYQCLCRSYSLVRIARGSYLTGSQLPYWSLSVLLWAMTSTAVVDLPVSSVIWNIRLFTDVSTFCDTS